jgi:hypothetical protein
LKRAKKKNKKIQRIEIKKDLKDLYFVKKKAKPFSYPFVCVTNKGHTTKGKAKAPKKYTPKRIKGIRLILN